MTMLTPGPSPEMLQYFRSHDLAAKRIREVGERAFGRFWDDDLRKALGLKSTTQLGSWLHANRAPPGLSGPADRRDPQGTRRGVRSHASCRSGAVYRAYRLARGMATKRLPEPRPPSDSPKVA